VKTRLRVDSKDFNRAVAAFSKTVKNKTIPQILNERTPFVLFAAMKKTPKVAKARITAALGSVSTPTALAFAIIYKRAKAKNERLSRDAAKKKAGAMIRARRASVRYVSLGWLKALSKWKQVQKPLKETSIAAKEGWGKRATRFAHRTKFRNAAPGVKHGVDALKQAMDAEGKKLKEWAAKRLQKTSNRYKGRKMF
tara:strand:+ start:182 stop:769 length:588 start_codon:yes stop_codon:yes gene_type:complete